MGHLGILKPFRHKKHPTYVYMYMGVGYNAIIDSALIFISASPSVTPCHGHTKNRMQYYAIICNIQIWVHNYMKAFNSAREEKNYFDVHIIRGHYL